MRLDEVNLRNDRNFLSSFCEVDGTCREVCGGCFSIAIYWLSTTGGDCIRGGLCFTQSSEDSIGESSGWVSSDSDESSCSPFSTSSFTLSVSSFVATELPQICGRGDARRAPGYR